MKVLCLYRLNSDVPEALRLNSNFTAAEYDLVVGRVYDVFGQAIFEGRLIYLVDPESACKPNWYPAELFDVVDRMLPASWKFAFFGRHYLNDLGAIWGYADLVEEPDHFNALAERHSEALRVFERQKILSRD